MRIIVSLVMSFMLVFSSWTIAADNAEKPKDTKTEKKADVKAAET